MSERDKGLPLANEEMDRHDFAGGTSKSQGAGPPRLPGQKLMNRRITQWLRERRGVARLAFMLALITRVGSSLMGLVWTRLLVATMGAELNGVYLAFQKLILLGGLGDLGFGSAVAIRTGEYLGQGKEDELRRFLASSRTVFLALTLTIGCGMVLLSPWLPKWLHFPTAVAGTGSLRLLFAVGAVLIAGVALASYFNGLNYACGNVVWPVIPTFILLQLAMLGNFLLARQHVPLWVQHLPFVATAIIGMCLINFYVRVSHPPLGRLFPLEFDWGLVKSLFESSIWTYLCYWGNALYRTTDGLVINAGFAPGTLVPYDNNYKFCDLVVFVVLTASFVSLPKITQWMASPHAADQERVRVEMKRLNQFQALLGCGAALAYLGGNNLFMKIWWWHGRVVVPSAPLMLQLAFALNLAVTTCGDAGIQMALRSGKRGLRIAGAAVGLTGFLNLGLSIVAMKHGSLVGIAMATVIAQSVLSIVASFYTCRFMKIAWLPWLLKGWLIPVVGISFAGWVRMKLAPLDSWQNIVLLVAIYAVMLLVAAWGLGVRVTMIKEELGIVRQFFVKKTVSQREN